MIAETFGRYMRVDPGFLKDMLARHPRLLDMYRFHIDTWCLDRYYPRIGDTNNFAKPNPRYNGVGFIPRSPLEPSGFTFLWKLYEVTQDADFVRVLYKANGSKVEGLPHDLFADSPSELQKQVGDVIAREGDELRVGDVNKQQWNLAVLRSGEGAHGCAAWLDYDTGGIHGHADAMNLGLFAKGLDLMPDFGYPPVHHGGDSSPKANWYRISAAHNTVVVDGNNSTPAAPALGAGKTTLWASGQQFRAIRASAPALVRAQQFERTVALVDISPTEAYVLDVFRVVGGTEHVKYMHSSYSELSTQGLTLEPAEGEGQGLQMQEFRIDRKPQVPWSADFAIEDRLNLLPQGTPVHLRCTDLTAGAEALTAAAWVSTGFTGNDDATIPRVLVRRRATEAPLASTFVSIIEPYGEASNIGAVRRLPLRIDGEDCGDATVAVEITLADGRRDLFISADVENPLRSQPGWRVGRTMVQDETALRFDGQACLVRRDAHGHAVWIALARAAALTVGDVSIRLRQGSEYVELSFDGTQVRVSAGKPDQIEQIQINGVAVTPEVP